MTIEQALSQVKKLDNLIEDKHDERFFINLISLCFILLSEENQELVLRSIEKTNLNPVV